MGTTLKAAIRRSEFEGMTNQQILDAGNALREISRDATPYTWAGIGQRLIANGISPMIVIGMRDTLSTCAGYSMLDGALLSGGFDCSDEINRGLIQSLEITDPPEAVVILDALLAIGIRMGTAWDIFQFSTPTLEDIQAAKDSNVVEDDIHKFSDLMQSVIQKFQNGTVTSFFQACQIVADEIDDSSNSSSSSPSSNSSNSSLGI